MGSDGNTAAGTRKVARPGTFHAYALGAEKVSPLPVPGIRFIYLDAARQRALAAAMHVADAEVSARLDEGGKAALALTEQGEIAGYGWIRYDAIQIDDLRFRLPLPPNHAYIWDCLTVPEHRGRGIFPGLLRFMLEQLRREGITEVWAGVEPGNEPSLRAFARAGFRLVAEIDIEDATRTLQLTGQARPTEAAVLGNPQSGR